MTSERNIPHLRDIFGGGGGGGGDEDDGLTDKLRRLDVSKGDDRNSLGGVSASGTDSAISVGSASEEDLLPAAMAAAVAAAAAAAAAAAEVKQPAGPVKKKRHHNKNGGRNTCRGAATFEEDVKHLERHLSMKKTIRKKIMRDLQQAFVEDPDEFKVEDIPPEQLKAQLNTRSLSFGMPGKKKGKMKSESNFLDFLRGGCNDQTAAGLRRGGYNSAAAAAAAAADESDSGHGSPTRELQLDDDEQPSIRKPSFWRRFTIKTGARNKR